MHARQRATNNIDKAEEPEETEKLAHRRLNHTLPVCANPRRETTTPDRTPVFLTPKKPGRNQTAIFLYREFLWRIRHVCMLALIAGTHMGSFCWPRNRLILRSM